LNASSGNINGIGEKIRTKNVISRPISKRNTDIHRIIDTGIVEMK